MESPHAVKKIPWFCAELPTMNQSARSARRTSRGPIASVFARRDRATKQHDRARDLSSRLFVAMGDDARGNTATARANASHQIAERRDQAGPNAAWTIGLVRGEAPGSISVRANDRSSRTTRWWRVVPERCAAGSRETWLRTAPINRRWIALPIAAPTPSFDDEVPELRVPATRRSRPRPQGVEEPASNVARSCRASG